jgi:hypothetical protein
LVEEGGMKTKAHRTDYDFLGGVVLFVAAMIVGAFTFWCLTR